MAVRAQCPRCRRFFDLTYWELCSRITRHLTAPWRGTCPFCSRRLRLRAWIEAVAFVVSGAGILVCWPIAQVSSVWIAIPFGIAAGYLAPGVWRYYAADTWKII
jgi:hypothetical protein